ncbi:DUF2085 domain-containing protein [Methanobrevibacter sp.]|uniref:DUF2085 domain-containing protein n=1 Tax=Methanobrevibacter sp. TaxID=66852 RepID=UPI0026DFBB2B|nr:DUF2085 domain-containing protein [Methanobrevibacter sp.]MDO5860251.1 DUF2085 domain-containing protein [Methanobrevibacter sp.]
MNILNLICHRKPERSFFIKGHQFPVCARCTGFYTGLIAFLIYNRFYAIDYTLNLLIISIFLLIPTSIDGFTQLLGYRESNNTLRFFTGFIGGIGLIIFLEIIIKWCLNYIL